MSDVPTWYDLLDVDRDASTDEIRAAWKSQIADLEPGDRRFDALNRAARVLLDPVARSSYDAEHPVVVDDDPVADEAPAPASVDRATPPLVEEGAPAPVTGPGSDDATPGGVPSWLLAGLAIVAAGLVAVTAWMWTSADSGAGGSAARDAQVAAERAVVPVLSYDYEHLADDQRAAQALMTGSYREEYDKLFAVLEENAPQTRTKVSAEVVASGIVRASTDRVQVLVFVDRPTTNKLSSEPVVYKDQVTLSMQLVDGEWLVDDLVTSPVQG
ncbi:Mce-associated membrane protein [Nocardioides exalbidus]|uniref:Mce-associated membrane protein n=1 Tax=Nocardioides exalbidus TaxID=402596 RepID=A0A1H4S3T0_9ACTN|nr:DnaJ domain-containing protein [Nocardioides exalbidus]SEC38491.1 Mce-associated membrane protein [Nocardioides exalbidus]